jgi:hypothetical protein
MFCNKLLQASIHSLCVFRDHVSEVEKKFEDILIKNY